MPPVAADTINEVDFCGKIAAAANPIFARLRERCPFVEARIEGIGSTTGKTKRKDLRFYGKDNRILITGEAKLPGGVSAFDSGLIADAQQKADHANAQYFFTWDVNRFVLFDRYKQDKSLLDRRINVWHLGLNLTSAQEVARPEILEQIVDGFLPGLIADLSDIVTGARQDWSLPPDEIFLRSLESHLDWPVILLREYLYNQSLTDRGFDTRLQGWMAEQGRQFLRSQPEEWREAVDNAARTLAYVWANRFIFYKALCARFHLPRLELGPAIRTAAQAMRRIDDMLQKGRRGKPRLRDPPISGGTRLGERLGVLSQRCRRRLERISPRDRGSRFPGRARRCDWPHLSKAHQPGRASSARPAFHRP